MENQARSQKYKIVIQWNEKTGGFLANAPQFEECLVHAPSQGEALQLVNEAIERYLAALEKQDRPAPRLLSEKKYSGKILLRIDPALHRDIAARASMADVTLTRFIEDKLREEQEGSNDDE